jgi:exoribonuclease-2
MRQDTLPSLRADSLVLYKTRPARVVSISDKIEIEFQEGNTKRVRSKDVVMLHPGPLHSLSELAPQSGDILEAWELLTDGSTDIGELSELIFAAYTPASAWAAWELVRDGLYFSGTPDAITAHSAEQVEQDRREREAKAAAEQAWSGFLGRLQRGELIEEDRSRLSEVEMLALRKREKSRIMQELGYQQSPEHAHRLLVKVGYWSPHHNPYPARLGVNTAIVDVAVAQIEDEQRRDLTHLPAFAIDDEGNQDPDDAISLDGERIWVHIADVAALIPPDSEPDQEARARGANLYIPERIVYMLPRAVTERLGLGLNETSCALSVGFSVSAEGRMENVELTPSRVKVTRLSYGEVDARMGEAPFAHMTQRFRDRRRRAGAAAIDLPEVSVRVRDGQVVIRPLSASASRDMVTDAMLMVGEVVAGHALGNNIPIPFATQPAPEEPRQPVDMAAMYAYRKLFKPSRLITQPEPHAGLGLTLYTRATSPLRRYSDLLVHQQLRAWLRGAETMSAQEITERIGVAELASASIRKAERLSNRHWTLVCSTLTGRGWAWSSRGMRNGVRSCCRPWEWRPG